MHVALVGTYPPTRCGIATFTSDVEESLRQHGVDVTIIEVAQRSTDRGLSIVRDDRCSYVRAAERVNALQCDVVLVQHEFGIYGGSDGGLLLDFTRNLTTPYVVTLHTVLPTFSYGEAAVVKTLCDEAAAVTVFTATARRLLFDQRLATGRALRVVPHGAPTALYAAFDESDVRCRFDLPASGPILSTFGLISNGKGIEVAIAALPGLVEKYPTLRYVVAGQTHPGAVEREGERYRHGLASLVEVLGLERHVVFLNRFLDIDEIAALLAVTDVFCTPYRGGDQIVSGALTFALAAGCPVVSTPYLYARDVLADGAGLLADFDDPKGFGEAIARMLADGPEREAARDAAGAAAATLSWTHVGRAIRSVLRDAIRPNTVFMHVPMASRRRDRVIEAVS